MIINISLALLSISSVIAGFFMFFYLVISNVRFTKGEIRDILQHFIYGSILTYGGLLCQFFVASLSLYQTCFEVLAYVFFLFGFSFNLYAAYKIHELSKVFGFASGRIPQRLKKILES